MEEGEKKPLELMIVDDHQMFIDGIKLLLHNYSGVHIAAEAFNGKQAIEMLAKQKIDFVITDIAMPEMNGIELTQKIKQTFPDIKVLVLTMYNDREIVNEIIRAEAEGYILKNTGKNELINAINKIADNGTYFCSEIRNIILQNNKNEKQKSFAASDEELTQREVEILRLICQEYSSAEIAKKLFISIHTVDTHRKHIIQKTKTKTIVGLIKYAIINNVVCL